MEGVVVLMYGNEDNRLRRLMLGLLAFLGPIAIGAVTIKVGGFWAFWYLCYFLMPAIPVVLVLYLIYKYIFQIAAEKVEDKFEDEGKEFLSMLKEQFSIVTDAVWDRSFRGRSRLSARKPFDRLALSVSESWFSLSGEQRYQLMEEIACTLHEWIRENGWERNKHTVRLDFYRDIQSPSSLLEQFQYPEDLGKKVTGKV